jgi:hypothetical protein
MPMGAMLVELAGDWSEWESVSQGRLPPEDNERIALKLLDTYFESKGRDSGVLRRHTMKLDVCGSRIHGAIAELEHKGRLKTTWGGLVTQVAKRPYREIASKLSGAKVFAPSTHVTQVANDLTAYETHPSVRSNVEAAVDTLLFRLVGERWCAVHRHEVTLQELDSTAKPRYSVDVLLVRDGKPLAAIDIGAGDLKKEQQYLRRRAYKRGWAGSFGLPYHECDLTGGEQSIKELDNCLRFVAGHLDVPFGFGRTELLEALGKRHESVVHMSITQLREFLLSRGERTQTAYFRLYEELKAADDPVWRTLPPPGTLPSMVRSANISWRHLFGGQPHGPGSRAKRRALGQTFEHYQDAKIAARRGEFCGMDDYHSRHAALDDRLPYSPEAIWPEEFALDGWPGFLGTGPSNRSLEGLVSAEVARKVLGLK